MGTFAVKGGIGDFLQCLPFMMAHPENLYLAASHYDRVVEFFEFFGVEVEELSLGRLGGIDECPRQLFFDRNPFPRRPPIFSGNRPVVGVHLGGSGYSLSVEKRFGFPPKALPRTTLHWLASLEFDYDFLVFGSPKELEEIGPVRGVKFAREKSVIDSLGRVAECSMLVGSDSAFKTMSSMLRISTIVMMGDYTDKHRDERFIDPYVKEGVMSVFRYKDMMREHVAAAEFCLKQMETICSLCPA